MTVDVISAELRNNAVSVVAARTMRHSEVGYFFQRYLSRRELSCKLKVRTLITGTPLSYFWKGSEEHIFYSSDYVVEPIGLRRVMLANGKLLMDIFTQGIVSYPLCSRVFVAQ